MDDFELMIAQNHPIIYKICRAYTGREDFDDLYQEILINLWKGKKNFAGRSKISTWLYRVALNTALTYQRKTKKYKDKVSLDQVAEVHEYQIKKEDEKQDIDRLYRAINQLKPANRSIILLYLEELSYEEIAEITGLTVSNVGVKINRIKKKLFQILKQTSHGR